ncbi:hypothetical protein QW131_27460 [Roseibium salinum]|nr:hypothetical protein [Roseibium salinum]
MRVLEMKKIGSFDEIVVCGQRTACDVIVKDVHQLSVDIEKEEFEETDGQDECRADPDQPVGIFDTSESPADEIKHDRDKKIPNCFQVEFRPQGQNKGHVAEIHGDDEVKDSIAAQHEQHCRAQKDHFSENDVAFRDAKSVGICEGKCEVERQRAKDDRIDRIEPELVSVLILRRQLKAQGLPRRRVRGRQHSLGSCPATVRDM